MFTFGCLLHCSIRATITDMYCLPCQLRRRMRTHVALSLSRFERPCALLINNVSLKSLRFCRCGEFSYHFPVLPGFFESVTTPVQNARTEH